MGENSTTTADTSSTATNPLTAEGASQSGNPQQTLPSHTTRKTVYITQPATTPTPPVTSVPDTAPGGDRFVTVAVSSGDVYTGSLILVNSESPYCYKVANLGTPTELDRLTPSQLAELGWASLYANKTGDYLLRSRLIFMRSEAYTAFNRMMADFASRTKNRDVQVRFAYQLINSTLDAASLSDERVTGLVVEINVYTEEGSYSIDHVSKKTSYYDWFALNCHSYGFVMSGESGVFRYVGLPHATYMTRNNLDLSEYLALIRGYSADKPLSVVDDSGKLWSVYFTPVGSGTLTDIRIPKDSVYTISGNNRDGFVVASYIK